jgi:D-inositol-3-phosphate glycosyltransferase
VLADLLVCASDIESLPRSILEAMAFELPVVSTDVFGVATLLDDGRTGWLTQVSDVRSLTATLDRVVRLDRSERAAVATRARADVVGRSGALSYGIRIARALDGLMRGASDPLAPLPAHQGPS